MANRGQDLQSVQSMLYGLREISHRANHLATFVSLQNASDWVVRPPVTRV